jgi:hypothetical protein
MSATASQAHRPGSLVNRIDHVFVPVSGASAALDALVNELGLPLVFPMTSHGSFMSGGITLGNLNVELIEDNSMMPWLAASTPHRIKGIVFEPASAGDDSYLSALDEQDISHSPPMSQPGASPGDPPLWTNIWLDGFISQDSGAVICSFGSLDSPGVPRQRALLDAVAGGALGLVEVREVIVGATEIEAATSCWRRLLGEPMCLFPSPVWVLSQGPQLRLVSGEQNQILELTLVAQDPALAAAMWSQRAGPLSDLRVKFVGAD